MENPILYRFTGTKPLQWFATMEAYFRYTEERSMNFSGWGGEERKVWFACKYLDIGDLDRFFQWMEGVTKKINWEAFKACVVYQFGTFEENCEFDGYEVDYGTKEHEPIQVIEEHESIKVIEEQESIQVIEVHESIQLEEEELIKNNQGNDENELLHQVRVLEEESIPEEEEVNEKINLIQDNDSKSMESLVMSVASQVSFSQLEPNLQCYNESMDVCEQHSSLAWDMLFESELGTTARLLGIELSSRFQVFKEKEYAHHLLDEMIVRKQRQQVEEIKSLFPKCWKFKFKNMMSLPIDQVIQCGVLPCLVEFLKEEDFLKLRFEAIGQFVNVVGDLFLCCGAIMPLLIQKEVGSSFTMVMQQHEKELLSLLPKSWKFKFKKHDSKQMDACKRDHVVMAAFYTEFQRLLERSISEPTTLPTFRSDDYHNQKLSLFPKNWKFKFRDIDLEREKQEWRQSDGDKCELNFQMGLLFVYGSLPRLPGNP